MGAFFAKPQSALAQPGMEFVPHEVITAFGQQELGFDPCQIEQVMLLVDTFDDLKDPPNFGLMVRFAGPQELPESLMEKMQLGNRGELNGNTIYRGESDFGEALYRHDERTYILGSETFINKMLSAKGAESRLIQQVGQAPPNGHMDLYVTMEPIRGMIKAELPPKNQIPPPFQDFLQLPDLIDSASINQDLSNGD